MKALLPDDKQLLSDQQLQDASPVQINDLVARIDMLLQRRGEPGLVLRQPEDMPEPCDLSGPQDPGTVGSE